MTRTIWRHPSNVRATDLQTEIGLTVEQCMAPMMCHSLSFSKGHLYLRSEPTSLSLAVNSYITVGAQARLRRGTTGFRQAVKAFRAHNPLRSRHVESHGRTDDVGASVAYFEA